MSVGAVDLDSFDADQAARDLAAVGGDTRARMAAELAADPNVVAAPPGAVAAAAPAVDAVSGGEAPQQGGPGPDGLHTPVAPGSTPGPATADGLAAPAGAFPAPPTIEPLGPPPAPPAVTGDPAKDVQANLQWQRDLNAHYVKATAHQTALQKHTAAVDAVKSAREAEVAGEFERQRGQEQERYQKERDRIALDIATATKARADAYGEVEGAKWGGKHTGAEIAALIASGIGAAYQNMAAAQVGAVGTAKNEALVGIERRMAREYEQKKARLAAAGDALLSARYGQKTSAENHRAALNDLDGDQAAKFKLIAKQAEEAIRARGGSDADVKQNEIVVKATQEAAKHEGQIQEREEGHQIARENAAANQSIARAHLGIARAQLEATRAAAEGKKDEKQEMEVVRGDDGKPIGRVPGGRGGASAFATRDADYHRAEKTLRELLQDIEDHGERVAMPDKIKRRNSKYSNAVIGVATVSPLGKTDSALHEEQASIGGSGAGLDAVVGANADAVRRKLHEITSQRQQYRTQTLIPLSEDEQAHFTRNTPAAAPAPAEHAPESHAARAPKKDDPAKEGFTAPGGVRYELGADGQYHKVK